MAAALHLTREYEWVSSQFTRRMRSYDLTYEELCTPGDRRAPVLERVAAFLSRPPVSDWRPKLKKLGRPLHELVQNYDDLRAACIAAKLQQHLDVTPITDPATPRD